MHFKGKELKPYAEPVLIEELEPGSVYFSVNFVDNDMLIPVIETLVFIGRNLDGEDKETLYFQDVDSYNQGIRYESATSKDYVRFFHCPESDAGNVFKYENALDELMRCSLRRKIQKEGNNI